MDSVAVRAPFSCFVDRTREPGRASVRKALAGARAAWDDLEAHLAETYGLKGMFHFMYGEKYGWALPSTGAAVSSWRCIRIRAT